MIKTQYTVNLYSKNQTHAQVILLMEFCLRYTKNRMWIKSSRYTQDIVAFQKTLWYDEFILLMKTNFVIFLVLYLHLSCFQKICLLKFWRNWIFSYYYYFFYRLEASQKCLYLIFLWNLYSYDLFLYRN